MSCQVVLSGVITDISSTRSCLFPTDEHKGSDSWLQLCELTVSPSGDLIVIANEKQIVVLSADWNINSSLFNYHITFSNTLEDDPITSVLCLPIVTQNQSSQIENEWTCITVGFQSGYVRFYTEDCKLLLSVQFHSENVCNIKCRSQHSPRPDINTELSVEEVYIQYPSNVCILSGNQLFGTLRSHRSQLIRGTLKVDPLESSSLVPKKWGFVDQFSICDSILVGLELSNTFDHLLTASTCGGFDTKYRVTVPNNSLVLAVGSKPFIGFHYAIEGGTHPMLTDVAKAIATKMKSALPNWLMGGKTQAEKHPTTATQPSEPMGCRFGLCDLHRTATSIIISPNRKLAAVTDILGRVLILDIHHGIIIRMYKGLRDAQCAFIQVAEERKSKHKSRTATFLVVYCPKKGTLEIFSVQQGVKIAVFTASKYGRLLYLTHGLMGFNTNSKSKYVCQFTCLLIDPDGKIKEIIVPFHFSLPEKNSRRARDVHLYKRLKQFVKTKNFVLEQLLAECLNTCRELKTSSIQLQCLEMLSSIRETHPEVTLKCAEYLLQKFKSSGVDDLEVESKNLKKFSENLFTVSQFFIFITKFQHSSDDQNGNQSSGPEKNFENKEIMKNKKKKKVLDENNTELIIGTKEMEILQKLLDLCISLNVNETVSEVSFCAEEFTFSHFLSAFDLTNCNQIFLKPKIEESLFFHVSKSIFGDFVLGMRNDLEDFKLNIINSNIAIKDLFKMLIYYWVHHPLSISINLEKEMQNLHLIVYEVIKTADTEDITVEYNRISKFWSEIREVLANSEKPFPALIAALICRSVSLAIEHEKELQKSGTSMEEENIEIWENLSQENCDWMLLIGKLEDVSLLNIILSNRPSIENSDLYTLPKLKQENAYISLKNILEKGKGSVSEYVAQWLTVVGINPENIIEKENHQQEESEHCSEQHTSNETILNLLGLIRKQFPYSTDASILLTNMCWEYALIWQKNIQEFSYLDAAFKCLNTIPNVHLKQGLYNLVWNTHLKIIFESACKLINKVGKTPKEKLCRQDTGLSDVQMSLFIKICTEFLDTYLEVIQLSYNSERIKLQYEGIWENGGQPLGELALQQTHINYDLVHLHFQLSLIIHMISTFNIKHSKPVNNLFDNMMVSLFFSDFQQKVQINWHKSESKVLASRMQFLLKVISASIETLTVNEEKVYSATHVKWMGKVLSLARVWNLDTDVLKRFQIVQLYTNGFDSVAEELLPAVTELDKLGPDLIGICGKRLLHYISSSTDLTEKITSISPELKQYLDTLNGDWCASSSLEAITNIVVNSLQFMSENQKEYKLATQLFEACSALQEIER